MDFNLLVVLDALIEHESVRDAAESLHLTPPAVSHALRRLRQATGDDVLVRNGRVMVPTPRALQLRDEVKELVTRATLVLSPTSTLDLARLERSFVVRGNDALLGAVAPALIAEVAQAAPGVTLILLGEQPVDGQELTRGTADLEIGGPRPPSTSLRSRTIGEDRLVVAMRREHPLADRGNLTLTELAGAMHVVVSRRGRLRGPIDDGLAAANLKRRVVASVPSTAIALDVVRRGDAVTLVASHLVPNENSIATLPLPLELAPLPAIITWHRRNESDPAHQWLRGRVADLLAGILIKPSAS